jgi:hypothetical protein
LKGKWYSEYLEIMLNVPETHTHWLHSAIPWRILNLNCLLIKFVTCVKFSLKTRLYLNETWQLGRSVCSA